MNIQLFFFLFIKCFCDVTSADHNPTPEPLIFRELKLIVYGIIKAGNDIKTFKDDWEMEVSVDDKVISKSGIAIGEDRFRCDENLNDYIKTDSELHHKDLKINIDFKNIKNSDKSFKVITINKLNVYPDDEKDLNPNSRTNLNHQIFQFENIIFRLSCYGFTGYNCEFSNLDNEKFATDFDTGYLVCKSIENCYEPDIKCDDRSYCSNHGECYISNDDNSKFCVCDEGWAGQTCDHEECWFDEEELYYGNSSRFCEQKPCDDANYCQNNGECTQYGTFKFCKCNRTRYTGKTCELVCKEDCIMGSNCTEDNNGTYCYPSLMYLAHIHNVVLPSETSNEDDKKNSKPSALIYLESSNEKFVTMISSFLAGGLIVIFSLLNTYFTYSWLNFPRKIEDNLLKRRNKKKK